MLEKLQMKLAFNMQQRLRFYRIMSRQTDNSKRGVKPVLVLSSLIRNEEMGKRGKQTPLSKLYRHIRSRLERGRLIGETLQEFAPSSEVSQIYASELSGRINIGFTKASEIAKQQATFRKIFKEALFTPLIQISMAIGILSMFFGELVPSLTNSIDKNNMSDYSSILVALADYFDPLLYLGLTIAITAIAWTIWALPNYNGKFRITLDKLPPFSVYRIMNGCSFLYALNSLMMSDMSQQQALLVINKSASPYLRYRINRILRQTDKSIGEALLNLRMNFPDKSVIDEIAMSSEQGVLVEAMPEIIANLNNDGVELITNQAKLTKAVAFIILVGTVVFLLSGVMSFILDLLTTAGI